jgi:uncharacterized DUF497 family protein
VFFEWDERKNQKNRLKHRVSFETAQEVFDDPRAVSFLEGVFEDEERWQTLGQVGGVVILIVVHTLRQEAGEEIVRIISARKATPRERSIYENQARKTE